MLLFILNNCHLPQEIQLKNKYCRDKILKSSIVSWVGGCIDL